MADSTRKYGPAALAAHMAELDHQLRHVSSPGQGCLSPHPALGRIDIACRLLGSLGDADSPGPWSALREAAARLCEAAALHPDRVPADWGPQWTAWAETLEDFLDDLDAGATPDAIAGAVPWRDLLAPAGQPDDRLGDLRLSDGEPVSFRYALLLSSSFQRDHLAERLTGLEPWVASGPRQVLDWLDGGSSPAVLLVDNLEPDCFLDRVLELPEVASRRHPVRVLHVAGAWGAGADRARLPGTDGVWSPPYDLEVLSQLIGRVDSSEAI